MTCPRCGHPATHEFYGPCAGCRVELRQLEAPASDPNFVVVTRMDGSRAVEYVGPRVDRGVS